MSEAVEAQGRGRAIERGLAIGPRTMVWVSGLSIAGAGWLALIAAAGETSFGVATMSWETLRALCLAAQSGDWSVAALLSGAAMWALMSVAMMAPTALPTIETYTSLIAKEVSGAALARRVACFALGYLVIWGGASVMFALAQTALRVVADVGARADAVGPLTASALLLLAGAYQFSALKAACLTQCRNPMAFFFGHWREGDQGALRMGLRHGVICAGCCWALMTLMFVFGVMNLIWMAALGALMLAEKAAPRADLVGRWLGVVLIVAGVAGIATQS